MTGFPSGSAINYFEDRLFLVGDDANHQPSIEVDDMINLPHAHRAFAQEKIEGICAEAVRGDRLILHLAADNDKGQSRLFKIQLSLE